MSTQDPYGPSDPHRGESGGQPDRTGSPAQPSWQSAPPAAPGGQGGYSGGPGGYDRPAPRNGLGITALVLGIVALLFSWTVVAGLLGLAAVVLGFLGSGRAKRGLATNRAMAVAGIVTGVLSILVAVAVAVAIVAFGTRAANCTSVLQDPSSTAEQYEQCLEEEFGVPQGPLDG